MLSYILDCVCHRNEQSVLLVVVGLTGLRDLIYMEYIHGHRSCDDFPFACWCFNSIFWFFVNMCPPELIAHSVKVFYCFRFPGFLVYRDGLRDIVLLCGFTDTARL